MPPENLNLQSTSCESGGSSLYLWFVCLVAAFGGLLFGYDAVVVSGTNSLVETQFSFTKAQLGYHPPFPESPRYPSNPPEAWKLAWYLRVKDLIDRYQPDLMYIDGSYPFDKGDVGRRLVAHYYNVNAKWHGGRNDAAMCIKKWPAESRHGVYRDGTCVQDIERGRAGEMRELPWQTDTCIGGWYYRVGTKYKTPAHVAHMLIDIVSKNGNLLLNLPLHPDGSLDDEEIAFLDAMGQWMKVNGEGIYGTRPWVICGEGPAKGAGGHFNEAATRYTSRDFRYTAKGESQVYAFFMKWPGDARLHLRALAKTAESGGTIEKVELLGHEGAVEFQHSDKGLTVRLPATPPCQHAWALRITGRKLRDFEMNNLADKRRRIGYRHLVAENQQKVWHCLELGRCSIRMRHPQLQAVMQRVGAPALLAVVDALARVI